MASSCPAHTRCNNLRAPSSTNNKLHLLPFTFTIGFHQHLRKTPKLPAGKVSMNHHIRKARRHIYGLSIPTRPKNERLTHLITAGPVCPPKRPKHRPNLLNPLRLDGGRERTPANGVMPLHVVRWRQLAPPATAPKVVIGSTAYQKRKVGRKVSGKPPFNLKRNLAIRLDRKRGAPVVERQCGSQTALHFHNAPSHDVCLDLSLLFNICALFICCSSGA